MPKFANKHLAELAHQLQLSPKHKRLAQVRGVESLLRLTEEDKSYPYDMVCFHITGYRNRRTVDRGTISGKQLLSDLPLLVDELTRKTAIPVGELDESYRGFEELAGDLEVSTKTIRRWGRHGLMGIRVMFEDGVARTVFLKTTIDRFVEQNAAIVERGASFKQLTEDERVQIVAGARALLGEKRRKLHVVAREIAEQTGRAVETIRYTLRRFDQANPDEALFAGDGLPSASPVSRRIWEAYRAGDGLEELAQRFDLTADAVAQVVREMTVRELKAEPVTYMYNELFDAPNAEALILDAPRPAAASNGKTVRPPKGLPAYLRSLYTVPLMTADQESDIFRRYNYVKHQMARRIEALDICNVAQVDLDAIAGMTAQVESIRQEIVQANLRLVVSITKKHVGWSPQFFEVISDGNMSLLRAVERFDYARGFKFSTYASWAIMKNYARTVPEEHYHFSRYVTGQEELLGATADHRGSDEGSLDNETLQNALKKGMNELNERERTIVTSHFGLFDSGPVKTLEELGVQFGVTKERIRQIERRAIGKIKGALSPQLAELLVD